MTPTTNDYTAEDRAAADRRWLLADEVAELHGEAKKLVGKRVIICNRVTSEPDGRAFEVERDVRSDLITPLPAIPVIPTEREEAMSYVTRTGNLAATPTLRKGERSTRASREPACTTRSEPMRLR